MEVDNILSSIGDSVIVKSTPTNGLTSIVGFTDLVTGETATRQLRREFRYTLDGINFNTWIDLTNANLAAIPILPTHDFNVEYRFTRIGTDETGDIVWSWINIEAIEVAMECPVNFSNSPFTFFFDCKDQHIINWCVNVLNKVYDKGIVSKTLTRGANQNENDEDRDYIDFWRSISCFYAMIVMYGRGFEGFKDNQTLLEKYLENRDISISNDDDIVNLQSTMEDYHQIIAHRGTIRGEEEIKDALSYNEFKDQYLAATEPTGWVLNDSSPLYKETVEGLWSIDYSNHPTIGAVVESQGEFTLPPSSGLGLATPTWQDGVNVDSSMDYRIRMLVKASDLTTGISVVVNGWDAAGSPINPQTLNIGGSNNTPISNLTLLKADEYYEINLIIRNFSSPFDPSDEYTKTFGGYNMKMISSISRIFTTISNSVGAGTLTIKDVQFSIANPTYSNVYVGCQNIRQSYMKNNSGRYSSDRIEEIIRESHSSYKEGVLNTIS